jgi:hypothetical protein
VRFEVGDLVEIWRGVSYYASQFGVIVGVNEGLDSPYRVSQIAPYDRATMVYNEDTLYGAAMTFGGPIVVKER